MPKAEKEKKKRRAKTAHSAAPATHAPAAPRRATADGALSPRVAAMAVDAFASEAERRATDAILAREAARVPPQSAAAAQLARMRAAAARAPIRIRGAAARPRTKAPDARPLRRRRSVDQPRARTAAHAVASDDDDASHSAGRADGGERRRLRSLSPPAARVVAGRSSALERARSGTSVRSTAGRSGARMRLSDEQPLGDELDRLIAARKEKKLAKFFGDTPSPGLLGAGGVPPLALSSSASPPRDAAPLHSQSLSPRGRRQQTDVETERRKSKLERVFGTRPSSFVLRKSSDRRKQRKQDKARAEMRTQSERPAMPGDAGAEVTREELREALSGINFHIDGLDAFEVAEEHLTPRSKQQLVEIVRERKREEIEARRAAEQSGDALERRVSSNAGGSDGDEPLSRHSSSAATGAQSASAEFDDASSDTGRTRSLSASLADAAPDDEFSVTDSDVDDALAELGVDEQQRRRLALLARERKKAKLQKMFGTRPASFLLNDNVGTPSDSAEPALLRTMRERQPSWAEKDATAPLDAADERPLSPRRARAASPDDERFDAEADERKRNARVIQLEVQIPHLGMYKTLLLSANEAPTVADALHKLRQLIPSLRDDVAHEMSLVVDNTDVPLHTYQSVRLFSDKHTNCVRVTPLARDAAARLAADAMPRGPRAWDSQHRREERRRAHKRNVALAQGDLPPLTEAPSFTALIQRPELTPHFEAFLKERMAAESLRALRDIEDYKRLRGDRHEMARAIFKYYIASGAPEEVNVSDVAVRDVLHRLPVAAADLFELVEDDLSTLLRTNYYQPFVRHIGFEPK